MRIAIGGVFIKITNFFRNISLEKDMYSDKKMFFIGRIALCVSAVAIVGVILTYFCNKSLVDLLITEQSDADSFINTIFQVHGGITTLSISILALITGLNKEKRYGIKTIEFMAIRNNFILNFYDEIVLSLILLLLQCIFVAYSALAAVEFIFVISTIIIVHMLYCCLKVTFFSEDVENEIREFILKSFKNSIEEENNRNESQEA